MNFTHLEEVNNRMNELNNTPIDKKNTPRFYADELHNLYSLMDIQPSDYPIVDPYQGYKRYFFYEALSSNPDIQNILKTKMLLIIKKYEKIYKLSLSPSCANMKISDLK
jgi:hypothetical protein